MNHANCSLHTGGNRHTPFIANKLKLKQAQSSGFGWSSSNWSGYAVTTRKGAINSIAGEWQVPKVNTRKKTSFSSAWIGIDGFRNNYLIQAGTEQDYYNGSAHYYAWWEILPAAERKIPFPVSPGDRMRAEIHNLGKGKWSIRLINRSKKWTFSTVRSYSGPRTSAEWIVEAPQINGRITAIADYGRITFDRCRVNGRKPKLSRSNGGIMTQNKVQVSTPSSPDIDRDGFAVAYGRKVPQPPVSTSKRKASFAVKKTKPLLKPELTAVV